MMNLKKGSRFFHKRVLSAPLFKSPAECEVTKVASYGFYYKIIENGDLVGCSDYCPWDYAPKIIQEN